VHSHLVKPALLQSPGLKCQCRCSQRRRTLAVSQKHHSSYAILPLHLHHSSILFPLTGKRRSAPRRPRCRSRTYTKAIPRCPCVRTPFHFITSHQIASHRIVVVVQLNMHTQLTRTCRKYRYMDSNLTQRRQGLEEKIPDIKKTLTMVEYLQERRVSLGLPIAHFLSYLPISSSFL
jgi:hypothetical protein